MGNRLQRWDTIKHIFFNSVNTETLNIVSFLGDGERLVERLYYVFRNNHEPLDCPRYHTAFNTYNIIPENCFSCFKVQVNVFNVVDLIKLHFLFDNMTFVKNIKKCMVEKRKDIDGNYKGFIYCKTFFYIFIFK